MERLFFNEYVLNNHNNKITHNSNNSNSSNNNKYFVNNQFNNLFIKISFFKSFHISTQLLPQTKIIKLTEK